MEPETVTGEGGETTITIDIKFGGRSIPISISLDSTVQDLKSLLQPLTNVLPRGQKLISKGKILVDKMTLRESELKNGAKVMLMASQGLHQADGPIVKEARTGPTPRKADGGGMDEMSGRKQMKQVSADRNRTERWKATGVIALSECNLKFLTDEVWACGSLARVLDLSNNSIRDITPQISCLSALQKLYLDVNDIVDESINWEGIVSLKHLTILSLNKNQLTTLPSTLGALTSLRQLHVADNKLTSIPVEIGLLTNLEILMAKRNRISIIPASIGNCSSLIDVDLSSNLLPELPETFGSLQNLKGLHLGNNGIKSIPSTLLKMCLQLTTLDLHNTEVTMDVLRQLEGWEAFDERRQTKHQKQLDFRVIGSGEFDEGADKNC